MVYINKVYTRFGDEGQTMLASGDTVSKSSDRVWCYGEVDELNATIGLLRIAVDSEGNAVPSAAEFAEMLQSELGAIQQQLFNLGSELATPDAPDAPKSKMPRVRDEHVQALEDAIDAHNEALEPLRSFILPGGGPTGAWAHLARTVCRRAERHLVALAQSEVLRPEAGRYLNRLSDYLFVIARAASLAFGHEEVLWDSRGT